MGRVEECWGREGLAPRAEMTKSTACVCACVQLAGSPTSARVAIEQKREKSKSESRGHRIDQDSETPEETRRVAKVTGLPIVGPLSYFLRAARGKNIVSWQFYVSDSCYD